MNRIQNPTTSDVVDYNLIEFLMRIDQNSGEVVWAKSYAFPSIHFALVYRKKLLFSKYFCTFCSSIYPTHPPVVVGGTCWKCLHLPQPPPELKNVTKIFYTKYFLSKFFNKI